MKLRVQADADLRQAIVDGCLRQFAEMDFQRAGTVPLKGLTDRAVLEVAAEYGRVVVSHDVTTMEAHFRDFVATHRSPGLVLIPQRRVSIGRAVESMILLWQIVSQAEMENRVCLVPSMVIYGFE
jgi:hypothetical protein